MIGRAHAECPSTVKGLIRGLSGADEAVIVVTFEMQLPSGTYAQTQANAACQTCVKAVVVAFHKMIGITHKGTGVVGHLHIAMTPLRQPVGRKAAKHKVDAHIFATHRQVGHQG